MLNKNLIQQGILGLLSLWIVSCGSVEGGFAPEASGTSDQEESFLLEGVTEIEFDTDNQALLHFDEVGENDSYVIALYSYEDSSDLHGFSVNAGVSSSNKNLTRPAALMNESAHSTEDLEEDFHDTLRNIESSFQDEEPLEAPYGGPKFLVTPLEVGSTRTFKVLNSLSGSTSYDTITAELRYISDDLYVYVDTRNTDIMTDSILQEVIVPFDSVIETEREMFNASESDVNGDERIAVLYTQQVNELGALGGGIISGYFFGGDEYSAKKYAASNEMEVIYSMIPDPQGSFGTAVSTEFALSNILPTVLPHEFQHMISYNQHVLVRKGAAEESFLNEAISHLAEDIYSYQEGFMSVSGIEHSSRVALYLTSTDSVSFTQGSSIYQRGGSYLFLRHLYELAQNGYLPGAKSGNELASLLVNTNLTGVSNIVKAALSSDDEERFQELLAQFGAAMYLSDLGVTDDKRYNFSGIKLHGAQNDNRNTVLDGPQVKELTSFPYADSVISSGISYMVVSGQQILEADGALSISLPGEINAGGFVIELK